MTEYVDPIRHARLDRASPGNKKTGFKSKLVESGSFDVY
jgi:hypothetical protein